MERFGTFVKSLSLEPLLLELQFGKLTPTDLVRKQINIGHESPMSLDFSEVRSYVVFNWL